MCRKNISKRGSLSRKRQDSTHSRKRYSIFSGLAQVGEKPIPVLTGKSAVCFFMKASQVEKEMGTSGVLTNPADLKAFKSYADSVAAMEAEAQKVKFK